jgi:hypothetical protein
MPVFTYDASAIRQDPNLFLLEADRKDPVVPNCQAATTKTPAATAMAGSKTNNNTNSLE